MTNGLLIDTDPALGLPLCDVDDALAIHLAARAGLPLEGLTTVFGNSTGADTYKIARVLGERYGVEVFRGADRPGQVETDAVERLLEHRGTVLAIGPLTNIAAALLRGARWDQLIVLGGTTSKRPNLRPLATTEFNFAMDPTAAQIALPSVDVLFPMEVCRQVLFGRPEVDALPPWMARHCEHWLNLAPLMTTHPGFHPWDVLPVVWMRFPDLFTTTRAVPIARFAPGFRGRIAFERARTGGCEVAVRVDAARFVRFWHDTLR